MQMCADVFMCAYARGWIVGKLWLGPRFCKGPLLIKTFAHCVFGTLSLCLLHTLHHSIHCPPTVVSELPQGPYQGQA